jgi:hypothetical protein
LGAQTAMDSDPELSASYCDEMVAALEEVVSAVSWQSFQKFMSNFNLLRLEDKKDYFLNPVLYSAYSVFL